MNVRDPRDRLEAAALVIFVVVALMIAGIVALFRAL